MVVGTASVTHATRSLVNVEKHGVSFKIFKGREGALYDVTYTVDDYLYHITVGSQEVVQIMISAMRYTL